MTATAPKKLPTLTRDECAFLLGWMREECAVREKLAAAIDAWGEPLVQPRGSDLLERMNAVKPLLDHLGELNRRRENLCGSITRRLGLGNRQVRISALIGLAPEERRADLSAARDALAKILRRSATINRRNTLVARAGLEFNRALLRTAFGDGVMSQTYDHHAATREAPSTTTYLDEEL